MRARDPRKPLTVEVTYAGGPTGTWILRARGHVWRFQTLDALGDCLQIISTGRRLHWIQH